LLLFNKSVLGCLDKKPKHSYTIPVIVSFTLPLPQ
jgi:hypothetical protein